MNPEVSFPHMHIAIQHLSRVAFTFFGIEMYWYGLIIGAAIAAGVLYGSLEAKRTGQDFELYTDFLVYAIIASIIGARLYYVIFTWDDYKGNLLKIFAVREGGLAIYGAVLAAIGTALWFTTKHKVNFRLFADTAAPGLILGQAIGRWGNFFNREAFGGYTDSFFAMRYVKDQVSFIPKQVLEHLVTVNGVEYIQVHPTFLYESLWCIFIFILMNVYKHYKKADGEVFALYLIGYGFGRFFIEGLRTDQLLLWGTGLAVSQLLSFVLIIVGVAAILFFRRKKLPVE